MDASSSLPSLADLQAWNGPDHGAVLVRAYALGGMEGGGYFLRAAAHPSRPVNDVTRIADAKGRLWERLGEGEIDVRWAGARCDGVSDDAAAIRRAANAGAILFPPGITHVGSNLTVESFSRFSSGAQVDLGPGVTLVFKSGLSAQRAHIFTGAGRVVCDAAGLTEGYPEWWGAKPNDGAFDCEPALSAALKACRLVQLAAVDYFIASTLVLDTSHRTLRGIGKIWEGPGTATRIIIRSPTKDCIRVGPGVNPGGGPNSFLKEVILSNFGAWRDGPVMAPAAGYGGPTGIKLQFCLNCEVIDIGSNEHSTAFSFTGVVYSRMRNCGAFRSASGLAPANDFFVGIYLDEASSIGLAAGDASLYFEDSAITVGGAPRLSSAVGVYCPNGFTDLFFSRIETAFLDRAMDLRADPSNNTSTQDLQIVDCVFDSCAIDGIYIEGDPAGADYRTNINILGCYIAAAGGGFQAGVRLRQLTGCISLTNNQVLGDGATSGGGIWADKVNGLISQGNMLSDCPAPVVLNRSLNCKISDVVNTSRNSTGHAAVSLEETRRSVIACVVRGQTATFEAGVRLVGGGNQFNEIACSGLDADCVRGGAGAKLVCDGRPVLEAGSFGSNNLATGVMA